MSLSHGWINPYLFVVAATGGQTGYVATNLIGYWDFNTSSSYSGSGATVYDLSGGSIGNLTISGTGSSYYGSTGAKSLSIPTATSYLTSTAFSHSFPSTGMSYEILCYYGSYSQGPFFFNGGASGQGTPWVEVYSNGVINVTMGGSSPLSVTGTYTTPAWRHFVFTCTSGGAVAMYVNGVAQGTGSAGTISSAAITLNLGNYYVGASGTNFGLNGYLGFARVYSRPLTSAEVITNYNATIAANSTYSLPAIVTQLEYPPSAMSTASWANPVSQTLTLGTSAFNTLATSTGTITYGGGVYTFLCSSSQSSTAEDVCNIFNKVNTDRWTPSSAGYTGAYTAGTYSTTVGTAQAGEWAQIQLPSAITLSSFILYPYSLDLTRAPASFMLAGSNNGSTWVSLSDQTGQTSWVAGVGITYTTSPGVAYSYYRLIIRAIQSGAGGWMSLGELRLFGV